MEVLAVQKTLEMGTTEKIAVEHLPGHFTFDNHQRCVRCGLALNLGAAVGMGLFPVYDFCKNGVGVWEAYQPVWIYDDFVWQLSPDPETVKIVFCGLAN